jgi:hypothetical protein
MFVKLIPYQRMFGEVSYLAKKREAGIDHRDRKQKLRHSGPVT